MKKFTVTRKEELSIITNYQLGSTCKEIALKWGCSWSTIRNVLIRNDIERRDQSARKVCRRDTVMSKFQIEVLEGLLLGDGCVQRKFVTPKLRLTNINLPFVEHIQKLYADFKPRIFKTKGGFGYFQDRKVFRQDSYRLQSLSDRSLNQFRDNWYKGDKKIVPKDLVFTPVNVRYWFYGDGCSNYRSYKDNPHAYVSVSFATCSFTLEECNSLCDQFIALGMYFHTSRAAGRTDQWVVEAQSQDAVLKFYKYIGECNVPCFQYKWKEAKN